MRRYRFQAALWAAFFFAVGGAHALPNPPVPVTFRGVWVVRESLTTRKEVDQALQFAKDRDFNHVFIQIRGRGDAYYSSLIVPRSERIREKGFDPLAYAIERGHDMGLNIHAWINVYLLWSARQPPRTKTHLYHMHPEWLEVSAAGKAQRDIDLAAPRNGNFEGVFLSPTHPEVNPYLQAVCTELILNYAIDGLHLDYIRFYDLDYGFNATGMAAFKKEHGFLPADAMTAEQLNRWHDYRRQKVTDLVTALHAIITISGKEVMLSAAVKPNLQVARHKYMQDWQLWLEQGIIDFAVPMMYVPEKEIYQSDLELIGERIDGQLREKVIVGVAVYNQTAAATAEKIKIARDYGFKGISVFSYDAHKTNLKHFDPIIEMIRK